MGWARRTSCRCVVSLALPLCMLGCPKTPSGNEADAGASLAAEAAAASQSALAVAASAEAPSGAQPPERMLVPLKLVVKGPTPPPEKGDFKLVVDIVANEPLVSPLALRLELPPGAKLVKGAKEESLTISAAGTTSKEYTIHIDAPLTTPIQVIGETKTEAGTSGLRAQRKYPSEPAASATINPLGRAPTGSASAAPSK